MGSGSRAAIERAFEQAGLAVPALAEVLAKSGIEPARADFGDHGGVGLALEPEHVPVVALVDSAVDDDRQRHLSPAELFLEVEPAFVPQADVQYDAAWPAAVVALEELPGRGERLDGEPRSVEERVQRASQAGIVVDDEDGRLSGHPPCLSGGKAPAAIAPAL